MPFLLEDRKPREVGVLKRHTDELWTLVQKRAVWRPMIFVYLYNALMVGAVTGGGMVMSALLMRSPRFCCCCIFSC